MACLGLTDDGQSFAASKAFLDSEDLRSTLSARYAVPQILWTPLCLKSNGYFGCKDIYDAHGNVEGHGTVAWDGICISMFADWLSNMV